MQISSPSATSTVGQSPTQAKAELQKAAKAFEAIFMRQMIGAMRSASLDEGLGDSSATQQFQDMSDAKVADNMAESGKGFGIADLLLRQFSQVVYAQAATSAKTETKA
jgi:flagellar protein FlgJ